MTKRYKAKDYKKQRLELQKEIKALDNRIIARCKEMIEQYPGVHMGTIDYANAPTAEVFTRDYLQGIEKHGMVTIFELMEAIEQHLANVHPHKQTAIEF